MSGILVYALHYDGAFNKNSLGAVSEGARLAGELGGECHVVVVGEPAGLSDDLCASLGNYGAAKSEQCARAFSKPTRSAAMSTSAADLVSSGFFLAPMIAFSDG